MLVKRPPKLMRKKLTKMALVGAGLGLIGGLLGSNYLKSNVRPSVNQKQEELMIKPKSEPKNDEKQKLGIKEHIENIIERLDPNNSVYEDIRSNARFSVDSAVYYARRLSRPKRIAFFRYLRRAEPRIVYHTVEKYMIYYAKLNNLDPNLLKFVFYHRLFDLRNPLGVENKGIIQKYKVKDLTTEDFEKDPFLGIEVGVNYLKKLAKKYHRVGTIPILTEYLYGPFASAKRFRKMMKIVRQQYKNYIANYDSLFNRVLVRAPGNLFLSNLELRLEGYIFYNLDSFKKLSKEEQIGVIFGFMKFISKQLAIDPKILFKIAFVESTLNPFAYNKRTSARGLLQIRPILFKELARHIDFKRLFSRNITFKDLENPYYNIVFGAIYLKYCLLNLDNNYDSALGAYNMGFNSFVKSYFKYKRLPGAAKRYLSKISNIDLRY